MSGSSPLESPWLIAIFVAAYTALGGFVMYLLRLIRQQGTDAIKITEAVKIDLLRENESVKQDLTQAVIAAAAVRDRELNVLQTQIEHRFQLMDDRFERGEKDRDLIRAENHENHKENAGRLDRIMERMASLATRADVQDMRGIRHDIGD